MTGTEDFGLVGATGVADGATERISVVLGYFDALVSRGLAQILSEDGNLQVIGADLDAATLEHTVALRAPRVAILDEATAVGSSVLERLKVAQPAIGLIVLTHRPALADGMRLLAKGASYMSTDVSAADILAVVHRTAEGRNMYMSHGRVVERSYHIKMASLTPREADVLAYLGRGQSHAEIAHDLQLGIETIRTHSKHIRSKLGASSTRELIGLSILERPL